MLCFQAICQAIQVTNLDLDVGPTNLDELLQVSYIQEVVDRPVPMHKVPRWSGVGDVVRRTWNEEPGSSDGFFWFLNYDMIFEMVFNFFKCLFVWITIIFCFLKASNLEADMEGAILGAKVPAKSSVASSSRPSHGCSM